MESGQLDSTSAEQTRWISYHILPTDVNDVQASSTETSLPSWQSQKSTATKVGAAKSYIFAVDCGTYHTAVNCARSSRLAARLIYNGLLPH